MPSRLLSSPRWPLGRRIAVLTAFVLVIGSIGIAAFAESAAQLRPPQDRYNVWAWEARNLPAKWLYDLGDLFREERSVEEQNADIARFFELTRQISRMEQDAAANETELRDLRKQRDDLENRVEDTLEDRISAVLDDFGLTRGLGILPDRVWPPVDFEFTDSPRNLVTSSRDRIELTGTELLRSDLTIEEIEAIEEETKQEKDLSAIAAATAGIGAYPTIVDYLGCYESALAVAAHEWMHNYLFFSPLGLNYYANNDVRTMNEVVADLVGHEVADEVMRRWPIAPSQPVPASPPPAPASPAVDLGAELRALRAEVEVMLAEGNIEEAEALMEQQRQSLEDRGVFIRKINQAYFAFNNLYAGEDGSPGAVNPIGPKIDDFRRRAESLSAFVREMRGITSVRELDALLAASE